MVLTDYTSGSRWRDLHKSLVTTVPSVDLPVSVDAAKRQAAVEGDSSRDSDFEEWIRAAAERVETDSRRALLTQTVVLRLDRFPGGRAAIELERPPIQEVESVEFYDSTGALAELPAEDFVVDVSSEPGRILPTSGTAWPATLIQQPGAVVVTFVCGWANPLLVPSVAKQAIRMLVAFWFRQAETAGMSNVRDVPHGYCDLVQRIKWGPDA